MDQLFEAFTTNYIPAIKIDLATAAMALLFIASIIYCIERLKELLGIFSDGIQGWQINRAFGGSGGFEAVRTRRAAMKYRGTAMGDLLARDYKRQIRDIENYEEQEDYSFSDKELSRLSVERGEERGSLPYDFTEDDNDEITGLSIDYDGRSNSRKHDFTYDDDDEFENLSVDYDYKYKG